jgi:outer membrane translocation and assembly module TamA
MIDPAKGVYFETVQETGEYFTTVTNQFFRSTWLLKKYKRLTSTTVIATAVDLGMMNAHDGFVNIPLSERFYIGGPESLRGFEYQRVGPVDAEGTPIGGRVKLVWNVFELRQTIYKQLGGALFFDTGAVWKNPDNIELSEIRYSPGVGLRADISIGVARADYGFNVSPKADEPLGAFYFSLGHAF